MRVLLDTNVVLDVLLQREPHIEYSAAVLGVVESGLVTGLVGATTITTIHVWSKRCLARAERAGVSRPSSRCAKSPRN